MLGWIMFILLMVIFFVMMFGISFILNMLMKTTWFPIGVYVIILLPIAFIMLWKQDLSVMENVMGIGLQGYLTVVAGFSGAYLSGKTIHFLRKSGYRMF